MELSKQLIAVGRRAQRRGISCPDPVDTPRAFLEWYRQRPAAVTRRAEFPKAGRGWVFVPAAR